MLTNMENPRRSFDRSREPGFKKPRLTEDLAPNPNGRPFPQRPNPVGHASALRFRPSDSETNDLSRTGGAYEPQPVSHQQQQQQHQELVSQYKTALAELTFNSKPIITNLTIIAGENLHVAKAIAATVCANILEVFCKAYRQVDPPVHQSMRHLFGTWKGVFPLQPLQLIEKELGFAPMINGSSSGATTSRPDPLSQRPPHSIHVNPKYLEKQRLQQSSREKGMVNDMVGTMANLKEDSERPARAAITAGRPFGDPSVKLNTHGMGVGRTSGKVTDQGHDRPWYGATSGVTETFSGQRNGFNSKHGSQNYSASKSVNADPRLRATQNIAGRSSSGLSSSWKNSEEEEFMWEMHSRLSEHDAANISNNSRKDLWTPDVSQKMDFESQLCKAQGIDGMGSRIDRETSADSLSIEQKNKTSYGRQISSAWPLQESHNTDGLAAINSSHSESYSATIGGLPTGTSSSLARIGMRPQTGRSHMGTSGFGILANVASGSTGTIGQQRFQSLGTASSPEQSPMRQRSPSPSFPAHRPHQQFQKLAEQDHPQTHSLPRADPKPSHFSGKLNVGSYKHSPEASSASISSFQPSRHYPFSQPPQPDSLQAEPSGQTQKPLMSQITKVGAASTLSEHTNPLPIETSEPSSTSSLLAAVMKSGILSNDSFTGSFPNKISQDVGQTPSQPPLPNGPMPAVFTTLGFGVDTETLSASASHDAITATANSSQEKVEQPPLPPGPPPPSSLVSNAPLQTSDAESKASNPISNLLSSLVAKGLISASKKDAPSLSSLQMPTQMQKKSPGMEGLMESLKKSSSLPSHQMPTQMQKKSPGMERSTESLNKRLDISTSSSFPASSIPSSLDAPGSLTMGELSFAEPATKSSFVSHRFASLDVEDLIGLEFRPDVIREFHSSVISGLLDDFPLSCSFCGLRLKFQEQLDRHLEWHALKKTDTALRRWYARSDDWIAGKARQLVFESTGSVNQLDKTTEMAELMVPADENQYACMLCGELFEDYFSQDRGEWMFKGAMYLTIPSKDGEIRTTNESAANSLIVHENCMSESSVHDLGLAGGIKMEKEV
ncbi:polyadenylation and cleavage factor homolog 4-like isoform X2 [Durio zibethinus]|uniref:Polyadenylation and cleavage factor homolog 4-like isoform X2 n=1 Tax=Durio zibethinus TaxID=66656 RepID=A0A6P5YZ61_DURZI|nr:polyadenylation and cleavage factor homolog 4-like isoform X2 [Durio zibethinus]